MYIVKYVQEINSEVNTFYLDFVDDTKKKVDVKS